MKYIKYITYCIMYIATNYIGVHAQKNINMIYVMRFLTKHKMQMKKYRLKRLDKYILHIPSTENNKFHKTIVTFALTGQRYTCEVGHN